MKKRRDWVFLLCDICPETKLKLAWSEEINVRRYKWDQRVENREKKMDKQSKVSGQRGLETE